MRLLRSGWRGIVLEYQYYFGENLTQMENLICSHINTSKYKLSPPDMCSKGSKYGNLNGALDGNSLGQEHEMYYFWGGRIFHSDMIKL